MVVTAWFIIINSALGEGPGSYRAADTILDGDGLDSGSVVQVEDFVIQCTGGAGVATVRSIVDSDSCRNDDAHLNTLLNMRITVDDRSVHGYRL